METFDSINNRRSIRNYLAKDVDSTLINKIISAGMMAPSAHNCQPWQFIVVRDKKVLSEVPKINKHAWMAVDAPVSILVCGDLSKEKSPGFWVQDCSAAIQNMLLAIHDLGLGAVWTGIYPKEDCVEGFRRLFKLPKNIVPLALIPLGYPADKISKPERFDASKVHNESW